MAAGHGGSRPGAGRKPRSEVFQKEIREAEKRIADKLPFVVDAMIDLAIGISIRETDRDGETRTYIRPPDAKAGMYVINRILGAPTQNIEQQVSGKDGGPLEVTSPAMKKAAEELAKWRQEQTEQLNSLSAPPTPPTSPTNTE